MLPNRIVLIGPSGSGKTQTALRLSELCGYEIADTDSAIVARIGMSIADFFGRFGEAAFRAVEAEELRLACSRDRTIVATGGGAVLSSANWAAMRPSSVIVGLSASPATLLARLDAHSARAGQAAARPLLSGDPETRLATMLAERAPLYSMADVVIGTDDLSVDQVATAVMDACAGAARKGLVPRLALDSSTGRSDIYVARGTRLNAAAVIRSRWPRARRAWIVSDTQVSRRWGGELADSLSSAGLGIVQLLVEPGEASKNMSEVERLCREMTDAGVTRRDVVVALGGGVVGDLAGFVASICLRGLPLMQIPTSLLAMVDSSVGGKTGVNLPAGKNLAGAFYQPGAVLIDPEYLSTLSRDEYRSGMAEVIKHSIIQPSTPLGGLSLGELLASLPLDPVPEDVIEEALALNVAIKHSVVEADERESGARMMLNLGHTAGHAIEASGYRYRHGEAVAVGMAAAFRIALYLDRVEADQVATVEAMLESAGLPCRFDGNVADVITRLSRDKKNVDGTLHWVLPRGEGGVEIVTGVESHVVERAIQDVRLSSAAAADGVTVL